MLKEILKWKNEEGIGICDSLQVNDYKYTFFNSANGYTIIEVFEMGFFIEGFEEWKLVLL